MTDRPAVAASPLDEYKHVGEDLRHFGILRLYRLTLLLGTTGAMVTAIASENVRSHALLFAAIKWGGLAVTVVFAIMDFRSGEHGLRLQARANALAATLGFASRPIASPWNPLSTTGAGRLLHLLLVACWLAVIALATMGR